MGYQRTRMIFSLRQITCKYADDDSLFSSSRGEWRMSPLISLIACRAHDFTDSTGLLLYEALCPQLTDSVFLEEDEPAHLLDSLLSTRLLPTARASFCMKPCAC